MRARARQLSLRHNADDFSAPARGIGVRPEIIAGSEEGRLAFTGATSWRPASDGPFCVIDIGGGSTEFIVGTDTVEGLVSVDVGSVRLTETQLKSDPPRPEELTNALALVDAHLDDVLREVPAVEDARTLVGVAGTITTVAAIEIGLIQYERERVHGFRLTRDAPRTSFARWPDRWRSACITPASTPRAPMSSSEVAAFWSPSCVDSMPITSPSATPTSSMGSSPR